jgi:sugar phosphate permease
VLFLGLTSLFTDISSEMLSTVLPLYVVFHLGFTPLQFGILDGLYQGIAALVRVISGLVADRWHRHKEVAAFGYGLSTVCRLGLLVVGGTWAGLVSVVLLDRVGKGVRTAPRDALISLSTAPAHLGLAFGVHRALDTAGALLGPLIAFGLLMLVPDGFDAVFVASLCAALVGFAVLTLFVENRPLVLAPS